MPVLINSHADIESAIREEESLSSGLYEIRFYLSEPLSENDMVAINETLESSGVDVKRLYQGREEGTRYLGIQYIRGLAAGGITFLPLAVIPLIGFGLVSALVGIGIFKFEDITSGIGRLMLIAIGGGIALVALLRKPIEKAVERKL